MKKTLAKIIVLSALIGAALLPIGIKKANALSYTCYYRDVSGSCLNLGAGYGNRRTYPFNTFFNAASTSYSPWGMHSRYGYYHWQPEDDDDDNDYWDEDDRYYEETRYYYDDDDDTVRPYRYQNRNYHGGSEYFEYEYAKYTQYRY